MFRFRARSPEPPPEGPAANPRPQPIQLLIDRGEPFFEPYADPASDWRYNLVFGDIAAMFHGSAQNAAGKPWAAIFAPSFDADAIMRVAQDPAVETLLRLLACQRLRANGVAAPSSGPLAVVIEMPQAGGLDTLAIYADGLVRYLNQSRTGLDSTDPACRVCQLGALVSALAPDVLSLAPSAIRRRGPPPMTMPQVRISLLTAEGSHVLEGAEADLERNVSVQALLRSAGLVVAASLDRWREMKGATRH